MLGLDEVDIIESLDGVVRENGGWAGVCVMENDGFLEGSLDGILGERDVGDGVDAAAIDRDPELCLGVSDAVANAYVLIACVRAMEFLLASFSLTLSRGLRRLTGDPSRSLRALSFSLSFPLSLSRSLSRSFSFSRSLLSSLPALVRNDAAFPAPFTFALILLCLLTNLFNSGLPPFWI